MTGPTDADVRRYAQERADATGRAYLVVGRDGIASKAWACCPENARLAREIGEEVLEVVRPMRR